MPESSFKPVFFADQLILGNPASSVAVVTLWSRKEKVAEGVPRELFAVIGQLYSPTRGLDPLVRNLLANPSIRRLVITGNDLSGSGQAVEDLFRNGVRRGKTTLGCECWLVNSPVEACIDLEVPLDAIEALCANVSCCRVDSAAMAAALEAFAKLPAAPYGEPRVFPKVEYRPLLFPSPATAHVVRGERVAQVWLEVINRVMRFGSESPTHYGAAQKEILDLVAVVESENPDDLYVPDYLPCTKKDLEEYFPRVLTAAEYKDTAYTYGQRLRTHFGIDQIEQMISKLAADLDTRSAAAVLWDSKTDNVAHGAPCINHIWARVRQGRLYLTATIRSNDMYSAWPENAFALRRLQALIADEVSKRSSVALALGDLVTLSESAHVYSDCWADAERVVAKFYDSEIAAAESRQDPSGSFVITLSGGQIVCEHISPAGEHVATFSGKTAARVAGLLTRAGALSKIDHALYIGRELAKAETALRSAKDFEYIQDQALKRRNMRIQKET